MSTLTPPPKTLNIHDVAKIMNSRLGVTLVAVLSAATDKNSPEDWADPYGNEPSNEIQTRLWSAHRTWEKITDRRSEHEARLWFTGDNSALGTSPILALRNGQSLEVEEASDAFLDGTWSL